MKNGEIFWSSLTFWKSIVNGIMKENSYSKYTLSDLTENVLKILPNSDKLPAFKALLYFEQEEYNKVILYYKHSIKIGQSVPLFKYAYSLAEVGCIDEAIECYSKLIETSPSSAAFNNRAILYKEKKQYSKALHDYSQAIELEEDESYYANRAILYVKFNNFDLAIDDMESAFLVNKNKECLITKAEFLVQANRLEEAKEEVEKYCNLGVWESNSQRLSRYNALIKQILG